MLSYHDPKYTNVKIELEVLSNGHSQFRIFQNVPLLVSFFLVMRLLGSSSLTRDQTRVLAVKVPTPNHETTREFPILVIPYSKHIFYYVHSMLVKFIGSIKELNKEHLKCFHHRAQESAQWTSLWTRKFPIHITMDVGRMPFDSILKPH